MLIKTKSKEFKNPNINLTRTILDGVQNVKGETKNA